jgi:hypothetical protein
VLRLLGEAARRRHSCAQSQSPLLLYFYRQLERTLMEHGARVTASRAARRIAVSIRSSNARLRAQGTADFANVIRSQSMLPNREGAIVGLPAKKQPPWRLLRFLLNRSVACWVRKYPARIAPRVGNLKHGERRPSGMVARSRRWIPGPRYSGANWKSWGRLRSALDLRNENSA